MIIFPVILPETIINCVLLIRNGAERSGLFCVALYVVQQIKTQQKVDIFSAVKHVRLYRPQCINDMVRFFKNIFAVLVLCILQRS